MSNVPEQLKAKIIGKNTSLIIDRVLYKNVLEQDDKTKLKDYLEKYNKKPSEFWLIKIKKILTPKQVVKAERIEKKKGEVAEKVSIEEFRKLKEDLAAIAALNDQYKNENDNLQQQVKELSEKAQQIKPQVKEGYKRSGEY